jgi:hypothetical protein
VVCVCRGEAPAQLLSSAQLQPASSRMPQLWRTRGRQHSLRGLQSRWLSAVILLNRGPAGEQLRGGGELRSWPLSLSLFFLIFL